MLEKLTEILEEYLGEKVEITPETELLSDLGMSSFDLIQLVCTIEEEFGIEILDRALKNIKTVGDVMSRIEEE